MSLSDRHLKLLVDRGLDSETVHRFGVESSLKLGTNCIAFPFLRAGRTINHKYRTLGETPKKFCMDTDAELCFWNEGAISDLGLEHLPLIITEGELDALSALQCGYIRTVSVPNGAPATQVGVSESRRYAFIETAPGVLKDVKEIILATDSDEPGINLMNDLAIRLGRGRCKWVKYPKGCKDLNDALQAYGDRGVTESIARAQWIDVPGLYRMNELPPITDPEACDIGIVGLEKHYRMRIGDMAVVTGIPGHGKTSFLNEVAGRMALKGWPVVFASFEQRPQTNHRRQLRTFHSGRLQLDMTTEETAAADAWIAQMFSFIVVSEDEDPTLDWVMERLATAVSRHGARLAIIDPWNELDHHRATNESETDYANYALRRLIKFARKMQIHLIIAAHPAKMQRGKDGKIPIPSLYDIAGSAHWNNRPDVGVIIHRTDETTTLIRVEKARYAEIGVRGDLYGSFAPERARYNMIEEPNLAGIDDR